MPAGTTVFKYVAFTAGDDGARPAFSPRRAENRDHAVRAATALSRTYAGAAAWCVVTDAAGLPIEEPEILFRNGTIGVLER